MRLSVPVRRPTDGARRRRSRGPSIEAVERRILLSTFTVDSTADDGEGTLRWAILQVNADTSPSAIRFDIPGTGVRTITLASALAPITRPVVIDARTQPDYAGRPLIQLDGSALTLVQNGLVVSGGESTIAGLVVSGFRGTGIVLASGSGNLVVSNYIGVDPTGASARPNGDGVLIVSSSSNTIGGAVGLGNVISGNLGNGVKITGTTLDTIGNKISGNLIGTTADGSQGLGNGQDGVLISGGLGANVGGSGPGLGNVVSGNKGNGLELNSGATGTKIVGNAIGLALDGAHAVPNLRDGVLLNSAPGTTIGGLTAPEANQISGNKGGGVRALTNTTGLVVQGNQIGTDSTGQIRFGNLGNGITLATSSNTIGGTSIGAGNIIAYNGSGAVGAGVQLMGLVSGVSILSNSIHDNAGLGINLGDGPTPNHTPSQAPGPNDWQNYPVLSVAQGDGQSTVASGTLTARPSQSYTIQFFWNDQPDPSGFGEGKRFVGSISVDTDSSGKATFNIPSLSGDMAGGYLSTTATSPQGNTSEFSQAVLVQPVSDLQVQLSATPNPAPQGGAVTYTAVVKNAGNLPAHHVVLSAQIPPGAIIGTATVSQGSSPVAQNGKLTARLDTLVPGASASVIFTIQPPPGFLGDLVALAQATMDELDEHPGDNSATVSVRVATTANLTLALAEGPTTGHVGDLLTYELTATNAGPSTATNVVLTLPFAPNTTYSNVTATQGAGVLQPDRLIVNLGAIAPGTSARIQLVLKATGLGPADAIASLTTDSFDPSFDDDSTSLSTIIRPRADVQLVMQAPVVAADGRQVVYGVTVYNAGPDDATGVTIQDLPPTQLLTGSQSATLDNGGPVSFANGIFTATVGDLARGASATLWIAAVVGSAQGTDLVNAARVSSTVDDPDDSNNAASRSTPVRPVGDLAVAMQSMAPTVPRGQSATFGLLVVNLGATTEPNASLAVPIPGWADLVSVSTTQGTAPAVSNGVIVAGLGELAPGASARMWLVLAPRPSASGILTVSASVQGDDADFNQANNATVAGVTLVPSAGLSVVVKPPAGLVCTDTAFTYSVTATATGPDAASGVAISAPLPNGLALVSASSSQGSATQDADGVVVARVGDLAVGQTVTLNLLVRPTAPAGASLSLDASASGDQFSPSLGLASPAVVMVHPTVDLRTTLSPMESQVDVGGYVTWISSVYNAGPSTATGVILNFPIGNAWSYVASTTTQGFVQAFSDRVTVQVGTLAPGAGVGVVVVLTPLVAGEGSLAAQAGGVEFDANPADGTTTASIPVLESPGVFQFAEASYSVPENGGSATLTVHRSVGARGTVTVPYTTFGGNATPGVDYQPVSGVLTFGPGETDKAILVPVLANPHDRYDEGIGVYLGAPSGGGMLGGRSAVPLTIRNLDPDFTPPQVQWVRFNGDANWISSITIGFSEPLAPTLALNGAGYGVLDLGATGVYGAADNSWMAFYPPSYNPSTQAVTIWPVQGLAAGHSYAIRVSSTGPGGLTDLAGNPLGGGADYTSLFARGTSLSYPDSAGNLVSFQVTGGGFLDITRNVAGDAQVVTLQQGVPGSTVLSGSVSKPRGRGNGVTTVGTIDGLGAFGQIQVTLKSPPFLVKSLPFALSTGKPLPGGRQPAPVRQAPVRPKVTPIRRPAVTASGVRRG